MRKVVYKMERDEAKARLSWKLLETAFLLYGKDEADSTPFDNSERGRACRTLGIDDCARVSAEDLRRICRRMSSEWHPDRQAENDKENARRRFFEIQDACEKLKSET